MLVHALVVFSAFFSGLFGVVSYSSVTVAGSSTSTSAAFTGLVLRGVMGCQVTKRTVTTRPFGTLILSGASGERGRALAAQQRAPLARVDGGGSPFGFKLALSF